MSLPPPAPDRTALVTGASSGIGREIARQLAARGHGVTLVARREEALRALADEIGGTVRAEVIVADLGRRRSRRAIAEQLERRALKVEILVNNAGFSTTGPVAGSDPEREVALVRTDVEAVVDLCSTFVPGMVRRGRGAVLNVASTSAFQPLPGQAAYAAAKAFVLSYTQALAGEVRRAGVTVTALCPGPVRTEFAEVAGFTDGEAEGALPKIMWEPVEAVAAAALTGLGRGRLVVVPGAANRLGAVGGHLTPRRLLLPIAARVHPALRR